MVFFFWFRAKPAIFIQGCVIIEFTPRAVGSCDVPSKLPQEINHHVLLNIPITKERRATKGGRRGSEWMGLLLRGQLI
jgi:hypothetical protein